MYGAPSLQALQPLSMPEKICVVLQQWDESWFFLYGNELYWETCDHIWKNKKTPCTLLYRVFDTCSRSLHFIEFICHDFQPIVCSRYVKCHLGGILASEICRVSAVDRCATSARIMTNVANFNFLSGRFHGQLVPAYVPTFSDVGSFKRLKMHEECLF